MQTVKKSLEEQQHKHIFSKKGRDTETTSNQLQIAEEARLIAEKDSEERKHEMEIGIEKVVKAWKEAQSTAESADREEQIAHN